MSKLNGKHWIFLGLTVTFLVSACQDPSDSDVTVAGESSHSDELTLESLRGNWLGSVAVAPDVEIRMAIQIIEKADGTLGANFASIDQGQDYVADTFVELDGTTLTVSAEFFGIWIEGDIAADRSTLDARISQGAESDPIVFERVDELPRVAPGRPQTPQPPFPYVNEDVRFENNADGVWLGGTLTQPFDAAGVPAVVFVAGSGPNHRNYGNDHQMPMVLADHLARNGVALLRYDKRGVNQSTGRFLEADTAAFARDAAAAVDYLRLREGIDPTRVGLIGHSEGSQVAAQAVAEFGADAAFVVSMGGVGLSALETTILQDQTQSEAEGATPAEVAILLDFSRRFYEALFEPHDTEEALRVRLRALYDALEGQERQTVVEWYGEYGQATGTLNPFRASRDVFVASMREPAPTIFWQEVDLPVLVLNGGKDSQVPAREHVEAVMSALAHPASISRVFPEVNHMFQTADTGAADEYDVIDETISPTVLEFIADWVRDLE
jgi:hypothetical protein